MNTDEARAILRGVENSETGLRSCIREPIPETAVVAHHLGMAVKAHLAGQRADAEELICLADLPVIREWTESIWGRGSPYVRFHSVTGSPAVCTAIERERLRMPTNAEQRLLHVRDGFDCRFCGIPVIRREIRVHLGKLYPNALPWGRKNSEQHAAFQAMWAQYDHVLPHSRGGSNDPENIVVTCAPCNFGRMSYTLEEVGLSDPRTREPLRSGWDGLERVLARAS